MKYLIILAFLLLTPNVCDAKQRSDAHRPAWLSGHLPKQSNNTYYLTVVSGEGTSLADARKGSQLLLVSDIMKSRGVVVSGSEIEKVLATSINGVANEEVVHDYTYKFELSSQKLAFHEIDEYWEKDKTGYTCYVLYAVAHDADRVHFDQFATTNHYGAQGLRSVVPGWGQIYKGSTGKGVTFICMEAASVAGIILSESTRASYANKVIEQPLHATEYHNRANNWATARNICIGAAGAIYVWNLIDALATKGAKRVVLKNQKVKFALYPTVGTDNAGIGLTCNF